VLTERGGLQMEKRSETFLMFCCGKDIIPEIKTLTWERACAVGQSSLAGMINAVWKCPECNTMAKAYVGQVSNEDIHTISKDGEIIEEFEDKLPF